MWISKVLLDTILADNKKLNDCVQIELSLRATAEGRLADAKTQKAKDDLTIDWMRHRINALEKQNAVLLQKVAGVAMPIPEIVPTRPGSISDTMSSFDTMPSFEDVGDAEADRLGIRHTADGSVEYTK